MRMKNKLHVATGGFLAALLMAGCGSAAPTPPPPVMAHGVAIREPLASPRPYGAADTAFGLDLLGAWCRADPQANLVLSPSSLASGLGMAYLGARGNTAQVMARVLRLPAAGGQALEAGLQARSAALRGLDAPGVTVDASDQVWADPTLKTNRGYLNNVATGYDAGLAQVPLLYHPDQAVAQIDHAIAIATHGQIPRLLAPGSLDGSNTGWMLTDALYLHADWATPFEADQTNPDEFTTAVGQKVTAPFMNGGRFHAVSLDGWTAVQLPYRGGKLAMIALLPPAGAGGCTLPSASALGTITTRLASPRDLIRSVALPKVNLASQVSLKDLLTKLGMGMTFTTAADFTALSAQACCIGLVEHAATLQVGEKGTIASAATAVSVQASSAELMAKQIVFDRPYLLLVTDTATGEPLFMARVTDPATR